MLFDSMTSMTSRSASKPRRELGPDEVEVVARSGIRRTDRRASARAPTGRSTARRAELALVAPRQGDQSSTRLPGSDRRTWATAASISVFPRRLCLVRQRAGVADARDDEAVARCARRPRGCSQASRSTRSSRAPREARYVYRSPAARRGRGRPRLLDMRLARRRVTAIGCCVDAAGNVSGYQLGCDV